MQALRQTYLDRRVSQECACMNALAMFMSHTPRQVPQEDVKIEVEEVPPACMAHASRDMFREHALLVLLAACFSEGILVVSSGL